MIGVGLLLVQLQGARSRADFDSMDALPEDWQAVPNEKEKCEEITRLTVDTAPINLDVQSALVQSSNSLQLLRLSKQTSTVSVGMKSCLTAGA